MIVGIAIWVVVGLIVMEDQIEHLIDRWSAVRIAKHTGQLPPEDSDE